MIIFTKLEGAYQYYTIKSTYHYHRQFEEAFSPAEKHFKKIIGIVAV